MRDDSTTPMPGNRAERVTMAAWTAAATGMRQTVGGDDAGADNPTLIEAGGQTRGFDSLLSISDLPREAFESGFDEAVEDALLQGFDLQGALDGRAPDRDARSDVDTSTPLPGLHELSDLGRS